MGAPLTTLPPIVETLCPHLLLTARDWFSAGNKTRKHHPAVYNTTGSNKGFKAIAKKAHWLGYTWSRPVGPHFAASGAETNLKKRTCMACHQAS